MAFYFFKNFRVKNFALGAGWPTLMQVKLSLEIFIICAIADAMPRCSIN
jgi:hypothetical protein